MRLEETRALPTDLRRRYLDALPAAQELFLEDAVRDARKLVLLEAGAPVGYAAILGDTLVELHLAQAARGARDAAFALVCEEGAVRSFLCKSFDAPAIAAAALRPARVTTAAWLFRAFEARPPAGEAALGCRQVGPEALDAVLAIHDGFFDGREEAARYARAGGLFLFEAGGEPVGCGVTARIVPDAPWVDVGMGVAPAHRRRGLGARIVAQLAARCLAAGDEPVCGCEAGNLASRRTLERAGFRTDHSLLRFAYDPGPAA